MKTLFIVLNCMYMIYSVFQRPVNAEVKKPEAGEKEIYILVYCL